MIKNMILNFPFLLCPGLKTIKPVAMDFNLCFLCIGNAVHASRTHERKAMQSILVTIMSRGLHSQGYPVYCFIEEWEPFILQPLLKPRVSQKNRDYRAAWFVFNDFLTVSHQKQPIFNCLASVWEEA